MWPSLLSTSQIDASGGRKQAGQGTSSELEEGIGRVRSGYPVGDPQPLKIDRAADDAKFYVGLGGEAGRSDSRCASISSTVEYWA